METNIPKVKQTRKKKPKTPVNLSMTKEKFNEVMALINDEGVCEEYFKPRCSIPIQHITSQNRNSYKCALPKQLEEARFCVMQRDWKNLAKILTMAKPSRKDHIVFFQVLVRYAVLCLAHNPNEELMDLFMKGVAACSNDTDKELFIKSLTNN